jgi:hypothetical protein
MSYFAAVTSSIKGTLNPLRRVEQWLLARAPMLWAERYHLAVVLGLIAGTAALVLGLAHGSAVSYVLDGKFEFPLERGLPAVPWCIAIAWWWSRAKGYDSLPLVKTCYGLHYSVYDMALLVCLLLIPLGYAWAFRSAAQVHGQELAQTVEEDARFRTLWRAWAQLSLDKISTKEVDREVKLLTGGTRDLDQLQQVSPSVILSKDAMTLLGMKDFDKRDYSLKALGIDEAVRMVDPDTRTAPAFVAQRKKLEDMLAPLVQKYGGLDLAPYFAAEHEGLLNARQAAELKMAEDRIERSFGAFHRFLTRDNVQPGLDSIELQVWILFPLLLTLLAIPATTARVYWMTWALIMTAAVSYVYFTEVFSGLITDRVEKILGYALAAGVSTVLLLTLVVGTIGKHTVVKMLCVVLPILMLVGVFMLLSDFEALWKQTAVHFATLLVIGALSRLIFNRLRALPEAM